jgi:hypothetical protein
MIRDGSRADFRFPREDNDEERRHRRGGGWMLTWHFDCGQFRPPRFKDSETRARARARVTSRRRRTPM